MTPYLLSNGKHGDADAKIKDLSAINERLERELGRPTDLPDANTTAHARINWWKDRFDDLRGDLDAARALADRLADALRLSDALFHAMPRNITTQAHRRSAVKMSTDDHPIDYVRSTLAAWKEVRRDP